MLPTVISTRCLQVHFGWQHFFSSRYPEMKIFPEDWGTYPKEYNREIHGPYNPSVYYGKRDTPFGDVKISELGAWFSRRNKSLRAMAGAISRAYFRYRMNWMSCKKPGPAFLYQYFFVIGFTGFLLDYPYVKRERSYRYH